MNNAGIPGVPCPFLWLNKRDYQQVFDVNVFGMIDVTLAFLPLIKAGHEGDDIL